MYLQLTIANNLGVDVNKITIQTKRLGLCFTTLMILHIALDIHLTYKLEEDSPMAN